ncbi:TPA: hypothetical protein ACP487_003572 [Klebsiella pneumoniae]
MAELTQDLNRIMFNMKNQLVQYSREDFEKYMGEGATPGIDQVPDWFKDAITDAFWEIWKASRDALNGENHPTIPEDMTPEMMTAVQLNSELGAYAVSNLSGAYDMFAEFWKVAHRAAMLHAGNSPANPDCWCRTCRPVVLNDMRFVVCPDCGNKRCPRANDHRNACTGSNEPGQEGSAYPDTPREVK